MPSKQNTKAITRWKKDNVDVIRLEPKKSAHIPARVQLAVNAGKSTSRQAYILSAILEKLERDRIPAIEDQHKAEAD